MAVVVDASVALNWTLQQPLTAAAIRVRERDEPIVAPPFIGLEAANVLARLVRSGVLSAEDAAAHLNDLVSGRIVLQDPIHAAYVALQLACEIGDSAYDCVYLALALELDCPLMTADARFAELAAAAGFGAHVELLGRDP